MTHASRTAYMTRLSPERTAVLVVDMQEKLLSAMPAERVQELVNNTVILLAAARELGVRVYATEQYPKGLGPTVAPVRAALEAAGVAAVEKITFDALGESRLKDALAGGPAPPPDAVIVAGMETHVCVFQTARSLVSAGMDTYVAVDAVASRREACRVVGLELCMCAGAIPTVVEAVVFDWLEKAGTPAFKVLSRLIR